MQLNNIWLGDISMPIHLLVINFYIGEYIHRFVIPISYVLPQNNWFYTNFQIGVDNDNNGLIIDDEEL